MCMLFFSVPTWLKLVVPESILYNIFIFSVSHSCLYVRWMDTFEWQFIFFPRILLTRIIWITDTSIFSTITIIIDFHNGYSETWWDSEMTSISLRKVERDSLRKYFYCFIIEEWQIFGMHTNLFTSLMTVKTNKSLILSSWSLAGLQKPLHYNALSSYYKLDGASKRDKICLVINFV